MGKFTVKLEGIEIVSWFCKLASKQACEIDVSRGKCVVDGKSVLGVYGLDLSKPVTVSVYDDSVLTEDFLEFLKQFSV